MSRLAARRPDRARLRIDRSPRGNRALVGWCGLALLVAAAGIGAAAAAGSRAAVSQTLDAGFDASGNIYLTFADGSPIGSSSPPGTLIPAGTYTIVLNNNGLDDYGNPHEYEIVGPGVNLSAGQAVQATWTATFQPGSTYVYEDVLNPTTERGVFGTPGSGAGTAPPAPPPSPAAPGSAAAAPGAARARAARAPSARRRPRSSGGGSSAP